MVKFDQGGFYCCYYFFQRRCFRNSLPPHGLQEVKNTVKKHMDEGVTEEGVTIEGKNI